MAPTNAPENPALYSPRWEQRLPVVPQIQVTRRCNQACSYCFQQHDGGIIDRDTVERIVSAVIAHNLRVDPQNPLIQIYWHGGEPLLAGIDFFRGIVEIEKGYPHLVFENRIQTNGTLMDEPMACFLAENRFQVGFSIDGPLPLHALHRRFAGSQLSAFEAAMRGIECYRRCRGPGRVAAIAVVTRSAIGQVSELFQFFKSLEAEVQLDIYDYRHLDIDAAGGLAAPPSLAPSSSEVGRFLIELFDLWFEDRERRVDFRELRQEVKMALQPHIDRGEPLHKKRCDFRRIIFSPEGQVFCCDQWVNDAASALGDIRSQGLESMLAKKALLWQQIKARLRGPGQGLACDRCEWGHQCGGGCVTCMKYNALVLQARRAGLSDQHWAQMALSSAWDQIQGETFYCEGFRALRRHVREAVARELKAAAPRCAAAST